MTDSEFYSNIRNKYVHVYVKKTKDNNLLYDVRISTDLGVVMKYFHVLSIGFFIDKNVL